MFVLNEKIILKNLFIRSLLFSLGLRPLKSGESSHIYLSTRDGRNKPPNNHDRARTASADYSAEKLPG